jgi:hypothetical protein
MYSSPHHLLHFVVESASTTTAQKQQLPIPSANLLPHGIPLPNRILSIRHRAAGAATASATRRRHPAGASFLTATTRTTFAQCFQIIQRSPARAGVRLHIKDFYLESCLSIRVGGEILTGFICHERMHFTQGFTCNSASFTYADAAHLVLLNPRRSPTGIRFRVASAGASNRHPYPWPFSFGEGGDGQSETACSVRRVRLP